MERESATFTYCCDSNPFSTLNQLGWARLSLPPLSLSVSVSLSLWFTVLGSLCVSVSHSVYFAVSLSLAVSPRDLKL